MQVSQLVRRGVEDEASARHYALYRSTLGLCFPLCAGSARKNGQARKTRQMDWILSLVSAVCQQLRVSGSKSHGRNHFRIN